MANEKKSVYEVLSAINVNKYVEEKNGLTYLSWADAWGILKRNYPDSFYTVYESDSSCNYHTDGKTCWVKTGITVVDGEWVMEHVEYLPVMDFKNKSIPVGNVTSMDVNKAIQRSLTKAIARHGLGLYIYSKEDLPESEKDAIEAASEAAAEAAAKERERVAVEGQMLKDACLEWSKFHGLINADGTYDLSEAQSHAKQFPEFDRKQYRAVAEYLLAECKQADK